MRAQDFQVPEQGRPRVAIGTAFSGGWISRWLLVVLSWVPTVGVGEDAKAEARAAEFDSKIKPLLEHYCYDCHGDGQAKGELSFDDAEKGAHHLDNRELWVRIWKNLRTDLMPPAKKDQPVAGERAEMVHWIERNVFGLDPAKPDPGRVTMRRLNRFEYRNTIQDLLGVEYNVTDNFPPDDTGYGFDTIGAVLSLSPLLMEKYLTAAAEIMGRAIPEVVGEPQGLVIDPREFKLEGNNSRTARFMRAGVAHRVGRDWETVSKGAHHLEVQYQVMARSSAKDFRAKWRILVDDKEHASREIRLGENKAQTISLDLDLEKGRHRIEFEMVPGKGGNENTALAVKVLKVEAREPHGGRRWEEYPESYRRIFSDGLPPKAPEERVRYARKVLQEFASRAYRRPVEDETLDRLVALAKVKGLTEGGGLEAGIRFALTAVLSSPDFLFRGELPPEGSAEAAPIDEHSLASRLSYFLWGSTPDDALLQLADEGALRKSLRASVDRMLADPKAERFVRNFVGQWLQTRELDGKFFDTPRILGIDDGNKARQIFNLYTRQDMKRETELFFAHLITENRPAVELITADYSFLNDRLAKFYGVEGFSGKEFRKVNLKGHSRLGGVLTHGSFLITTSNPTRTSPVKRGLFVLDNLLGVPPPPAPPEIPDLEEAREKLGQGATMRKMMEHHRAKPLCHSCHARMDPIGLALEGYNAIGQWRETEEGKSLDTAGVLVTGEKFEGVAELRQILAGPRKKDFHRCLTEKLLVYALGRGVEYYDAPAVDGIISKAEKAGGGLREILYGVVESAPFQLVRGKGK